MKSRSLITTYSLVAAVLAICTMPFIADAFSVGASHHSAVSPLMMSTTTAPPREKTQTDRKTRRRWMGDEDESNDDDDDIVRYNDKPLEYLEDEWSTRNPEDPFHILLLDSTFSKSERVTVTYVTGCVTYVTGMPEQEAFELTSMAALNGMSCLGTWEREECLRLGRQLQVRDVEVRVVPFCEGGARGWQAKDAAASDADAYSGGSNGFQ